MKKIHGKKLEGLRGVNKEAVAIDFANKHKKQMVAVFTSVIIFVVVGVSFWGGLKYREVKAVNLFSKAKNSLDFKAIVDNYSYTKVRALALLMYGKQLYDEGLYDKAIKYNSKFIEKYPKHTLVASARINRAQCYEEMGNNEKANVAFSSISKHYPKTPWAEEAVSALLRLKNS